MNEWTDISLDLETTGTRSDRTSIIQIGAVKFNFETGEVCNDLFDRALHPMPHRYWDEDTRAFWSKFPAVYQGIVARAEDPVTVFRDFAEWAKPSSRGPLRLWAAPLSFEWPFIESHFHDLNIHSPFRYQNCVDMKSFIAGRNKTADLSKIGEMMKSPPFDGTPHHALHDALYQLKVLLTFGRDPS